LKKNLSYLLRISITALLLIFLFSKTDVKGLSDIVRHARVSYLASALLLFLFLNFLIVLRWQTLLRGLSLHVPLSRVFVSYLASQFFNLVLPSTIGGDTLRTLDIARYTQTPSSAVLATVVLDRVAGFFGLVVVLALALFFGASLLNDTAVLIATFVLLGIVFFMGGIAFSRRFFHTVFKYIPFKKVKEYFYQIHESTSSFKGRPRVLAQALFLAFFVQAGLPLMYYWAAYAVGAPTDLLTFFIFVPIITAFSVIPVSIGGLGVRDTACVALFAKVGIAAEKAFAISLVNFIFILFLGLCGGLTYVFALSRRRV
jgi:uncharacterized protein (TIRG00374 family)